MPNSPALRIQTLVERMVFLAGDMPTISAGIGAHIVPNIAGFGAQLAGLWARNFALAAFVVDAGELAMFADHYLMLARVMVLKALVVMPAIGRGGGCGGDAKQ